MFVKVHASLFSFSFCFCALLILLLHAAPLLLSSAGFARAVAQKGLFGLGQVPDGSSLSTRLLAISPETGSMHQIGKLIRSDGLAQELSAIDRDAGVMYAIGYNFTSRSSSLLGIELESGELQVDLTLPFSSAEFVGVGFDIAVCGEGSCHCRRP